MNIAVSQMDETAQNTVVLAANNLCGNPFLEEQSHAPDEAMASFKLRAILTSGDGIVRLRCCGSGVTACVVILALATLGANDVTL